LVHQEYENNIIIDDTYNFNTVQAVNCEATTKNISSYLWKQEFPEEFMELNYSKQDCGFYLLASMVRHFNGISPTLIDIKTDLVESYLHYSQYSSQIVDILILEGKKTQGLRVKQGLISIQQMVFLEDYFVTNLDIWMICDKYQIPCILISSKPLVISKKKKIAFALHGRREDNFIFIYSPAMRPENVPKYSIIVDNIPNSDPYYPLETVKLDKNPLILDAIASVILLSEFLETFNKKDIVKKAKKKFIIQDDSESDEGEKEE